jgi:RNA polymerase sigma-70 factor (ECF subfamily)
MNTTHPSLLDRLRDGGNDGAWRRFDALYRPLIQRWVRQDPALRDDADDLVHEVLIILLRELPVFRRQRVGSFRCWLREVTYNQVRTFRRKQGRRPRIEGDGPLAGLADANSDLSRRWDDEHNRHVVGRLLDLLDTDSAFDPVTVRAFRIVVFEGVKPAEAAATLGLSVGAVWLAKSRILKWLRQEAEGLLD